MLLDGEAWVAAVGKGVRLRDGIDGRVCGVDRERRVGFWWRREEKVLVASV